jgi:hypothetical protein
MRQGAPRPAGPQPPDRERAGEQQVRADVEGCLRRMNIETAGLDALSPQEMAELELVLGGGDSDSEKRQQAERIIGQQASLVTAGVGGRPSRAGRTISGAPASEN